jgi:hypothetical protein
MLNLVLLSFHKKRRRRGLLFVIFILINLSHDADFTKSAWLLWYSLRSIILVADSENRYIRICDKNYGTEGVANKRPKALHPTVSGTLEYY